jgi:hypothetical protein
MFAIFRLKINQTFNCFHAVKGDREFLGKNLNKAWRVLGVELEGCKFRFREVLMLFHV